MSAEPVVCWPCSSGSWFDAWRTVSSEQVNRQQLLPIEMLAREKCNKNALASNAFGVALREPTDERSRVKTKASHLFAASARDYYFSGNNESNASLAKQPYAKLQKLYLYSRFLCLLCILQSLLFAFNPLCCTFSFLFLPVFVFFRAIQLKCTRDGFVLILLSLLLLLRSISPTFAPFQHLNAFSIELEWKPNRNFASMQIPKASLSRWPFHRPKWMCRLFRGDSVWPRLGAIVLAQFMILIRIFVRLWIIYQL